MLLIIKVFRSESLKLTKRKNIDSIVIKMGHSFHFYYQNLIDTENV